MLRNGHLQNHSSEKSDCLDKITCTTDSAINVESNSKARENQVNQPIPKIPFLVPSCHEGVGVLKAKMVTSFTQFQP
jgi:hypothetical protein